MAHHTFKITSIIVCFVPFLMQSVARFPSIRHNGISVGFHRTDDHLAANIDIRDNEVEVNFAFH